MGSAVAVRLNDVGSDNERTYLLTCLHVICRIDPKTNKVLGLKNSVITCFPPGEGTDSPQKVDATVAKALSPIADDLVGRTIEIAEDWVLLDVDNINFQKSAPVVRQFHQGTELEAVNSCRVVGYPGGRSAFSTGVVQNLDESYSISRQGSFNHWIVDSKGARAGASGGGVFEPDGKLLGIHRSRYDKAAANYVVPISGILSNLASDVQPVTRKSPAPDWLERLANACLKNPIMTTCVMLAIVALAVFMMPKAEKPTEIKTREARKILDTVEQKLAANVDNYEEDINTDYKQDLVSFGAINIGMMYVYDAKPAADGAWTLNALPADEKSIKEYNDFGKDGVLGFCITVDQKTWPEQWNGFTASDFSSEDNDFKDARFHVRVTDVSVRMAGFGIIDCTCTRVITDD